MSGFTFVKEVIYILLYGLITFLKNTVSYGKSFFSKGFKKKVNACISPDKRHTSVTSVVINPLDNSLSYKHICFLKTNPL